MPPSFRAVYVLLVVLLVASALVAQTAVAHADSSSMFGDEAVERVTQLQASDLVSPQTKACLSCHLQYTPGIVYQWASSEHSKHKASEAGRLYDLIKQPEWKDKIASKFKNYQYVVGCYECHGMFKDQDRPDIAENHFGYKIVTVVTRKDCGQCHPKEDTEISWTWHATSALHAPFLPWYKAILAWAKKQGADPFGDADAKAKYEEYFPPYLTNERDKAPIYWSFYKKIARSVMNYLETGKEDSVVKALREATGMVTPYDNDLKNWISPLWPASGVLNSTVPRRWSIKPTVNAMGNRSESIDNPMSHSMFRNGYIYHACGECHGTIVVPYKKETVNVRGASFERVELWGWPSNGASRVDPDGSMGACTACHTRHMFSLKQAREPETCGQCHLGYDHPHIEIYEESKHGNIKAAYGEEWNWERLPWRVGVDFNAPTCALCHMSTVAKPSGEIVVKGTHDFNLRLVWDQMHFFSHPKGVIPDKPQQAMYLGGWSQLKSKMEDAAKAAAKISPNAPDEYKSPVFAGLKIVEDGGKPGEAKFPRMLGIVYTGELKEHREEMKKVCLQCHSSQWTDNFFRTADQNMIDYDIVARFANALLKLAWAEGIHDKTNNIDEYMEIMWYYIWHHDGRRWRNGATMMGPDYAHWYGIVDTVMDKLGRMISYLDTALKIKALQASISTSGGTSGSMPGEELQKLKNELASLKAKLAAMEAEVPALKSRLSSLETDFSSLESDVSKQKEDVSKLVEEIDKLSKQLPSSAKTKDIQGIVEDIKKQVSYLEEQVQSASTAAEEAKAAASSMSLASNTISAVAIVIAVVAIGLALVYARRG